MLIGLILIGYNYYFAPQAAPEPTATEEVAPATEQEEGTTQQAVTGEVAISDSLKELQLRQESGLFYSKVQAAAQEEFFTLENEQLKLVFSSKGARIVKAELKEYSTYDSLPIRLIDSAHVWQLLMQSERLYRSADLHFQVEERSNALVFTAPTLKGTPLSLSFELKDDSYELLWDVDMNGLGFTETALEWGVQTVRQEKNIENEGQQTQLHYLLKEKDKHKELSATSVKEVEKEEVRWVAYKQQFFSSIIQADEPFQRARMASAPLSDGVHTKSFGSLLQFPGKDGLSGSMFFTPNQYDLLKAHGQDFEKIIPLGGWIFGWLNRVVTINVFHLLENQGLNYGLIIFLMALLIKLVLSPLTYSSYLSMAKMRVLKPEIDQLNEKFADKDPMKKQSAMMDLYRKAGVNPLGGCIPMLLQFPILIAVFRFFPASIELRQQSFLWATDLSTFDSILDLPFDIPFYGAHVSLFTLLMTLSTLIYTYFNQQLTQQNAQFPQMKYLMYLMPVMFLGFFNNYAAGLSYYYFVSNVLTFSQQYGIRKMVNDEKILAKLEENRKKPKKQSKFQQRLDAMAKNQQEQLKSNRRIRRQ